MLHVLLGEVRSLPAHRFGGSPVECLLPVGLTENERPDVEHAGCYGNYAKIGG
jgi:hypothetical protein